MLNTPLEYSLCALTIDDSEKVLCQFFNGSRVTTLPRQVLTTISCHLVKLLLICMTVCYKEITRNTTKLITKINQASILTATRF